MEVRCDERSEGSPKAEAGIEGSMTSESLICSVCIATYRRPELLEKLVKSLSDQVLPDGVNLEVIAVDNDPEGSARGVIERVRDSGKTSFRYCVQPMKNISLARNMAVEKAKGRYVLFIDDDEIASAEWVAAHLKAVDEYDADGVFGPVITEFSRNTPEWIKESRFFTSVHSVDATGAEAESTWAGNCLVKASLLKEVSGPFDPRYGITGGEDTHLFERLKHKGARFVYCKEARVSEFIPPSRATVSYLVKRGFKWGNIHTRRVIEFAARPKLGVRLFMLGKALTFGILSLILAVITVPSVTWRTHWLIKLASNIGRFLSVFGWHYRAYK